LETGYARYVAALVALLASILLCGAADVRAQETTVEETAPEEPVPPEVAARAWALVDLRSGEYLAGENATDQLPMASTTKIMVALLALEEASLEEEVTVSEEAAAFAVPLYSNVGLLPGDSLSVRELLMATLISSGDDAAYALAEHLGGGSAQHFVERMNRKAVSMGLEDTRFENPIGLDARGHYSSARDLATMTRLALEYPTFRQMVATPYAAVYTQNREIPLANTNDLLDLYPEATGVKTGTTPGAGPSLVASAHSADESYVAVFLDSEEDRFAAAVRTLEHGFKSYDREELVLAGEVYAEAGVPYRRGETVGLLAEESVEGLVYRGAEVERETRVVEELPDSVRPGEKLGTVVLSVDGEIVGESPLVTREGYDEASLWERVWYTVEGLFA
jgi:serine-type D-Ala-D-Ala carboxypeptidase (penicillin-binding protein 5/6)